MDSQILNTYHKEDRKTRINQGDILKDIALISFGGYDEDKEGIFIKTTLKYAVIITQDCDLEQDYNQRLAPSGSNDKYLSNILVMPAFLPEEFKAGTHRGTAIKCETWNSDKFKSIKQNQIQRFHKIDSDTNLQVPELILDFKHVYSVNRDFIYNEIYKHYLATICELYRENIAHRYTHYLSRIGLPDNSAP